VVLGHISYANCWPVHGPLLLGDVRFPGEIVQGDPGRLNRLLAAGRVQVAPCSSIEYARHAHRYRILPGLAIASRGPARSILLASRLPPEELDGRAVALPTASASSAVLLEVWLEGRHGASPRYTWFDQVEQDPFLRHDAALFIGDAALRRRETAEPGLHWTDLGEAWTAWTGLPFVYALWQVHAAPSLEGDLVRAAEALGESRAAARDLEALAERYPQSFPGGQAALLRYWRELHYDLDAEDLAGLREFYRLAAARGRIARAPALRYLAETAPAAS
jgi:chorismate dehydratase